MREDAVDAERFFCEFDEPELAPPVRVPDRNARGGGRMAFEEAKVKMVMRIEGCGREEALRIIDARFAAQWAKEVARRNAHGLGFNR